MQIKLKTLLFFSLLLIFLITFFARNNYRSVNDLDPQTFKQPIQTQTNKENIIKFTKNNYSYELTPLYEYELSGLVIGRMDYGFLGFYSSDAVFQNDLCVIWGNNVKNKVYKDKSLHFRQDQRFYYYYTTNPNSQFNQDEAANNHLIASNPEVEKALKNVFAGDQIKITGKLVNVSAKLVGAGKTFDSDSFTWNTSTTRTDSGNGACEVIYVESIQTLKKGNEVARILHTASFYGLILFIILFAIDFLVALSKFKKSSVE